MVYSQPRNIFVKRDVKLTEPPDAEPHVRWCERSAAKAVSYSITSKSDIKAAEILLAAKEFRGANNRAYYGIYHAILAVHALDGNAYKRHKDALANFNKNYVKTEIFPRKLGKKIVESEEIRHASDYDDFYIATREEAEEQIQTAKELVSRVEEYVQARWKKESEKTVRNAEYLDMIDRGIAQLSAGNGQEHELNETDCGCLTT